MYHAFRRKSADWSRLDYNDQYDFTTFYWGTRVIYCSREAGADEGSIGSWWRERESFSESEHESYLVFSIAWISRSILVR